jgi:hypothetical protein
LGAKWGATNALVIQEQEFQAEPQERTRTLCVELSAALDKTRESMSDQTKDVTDRYSDERSDWMILSHLAAANGAPLAIHEAINHVSGSCIRNDAKGHLVTAEPSQMIRR